MWSNDEIELLERNIEEYVRVSSLLFYFCFKAAQVKDSRTLGSIQCGMILATFFTLQYSNETSDSNRTHVEVTDLKHAKKFFSPNKSYLHNLFVFERSY